MIRVLELATIILVLVLVLGFLKGLLRRGASDGGGGGVALAGAVTDAAVAKRLRDISVSLQEISASLKELARRRPG